MIKLYFSTVKLLAQRPTHISAVATVLLITKTFVMKYYDRTIIIDKYSVNNNHNNNNKNNNNNTHKTRQ